MIRKRLLIPALSLAFLMTGCGGDDEAPMADKSKDGAAPAKTSSKRVAFPAAMAKSEISGTVTFKGKYRRPRKMKIEGDAVCEGAHTGGMAINETLLVDKATMGIKNVFVYIKKGAEGWDFPTPSKPVVVNQKGCMYSPHVLGVMAGQAVEIKSADATTHNVHFIGKMNAEFNMTQKQGQTDSKTFSREEIMARFKCDIHSWMGAYVGILYHPFYGVTNTQGGFTLDKLPAGEYVIEAWHEKLGTVSQTVTLGDGESKNLSFNFSKS